MIVFFLSLNIILVTIWGTRIWRNTERILKALGQKNCVPEIHQNAKEAME